MTYVKIGGKQYPAVITGKMSDKDWDGRPSKSVRLEMTPDEALADWVEGAAWSIVDETVVSNPQLDENGNILVDEAGNPVMVEAVNTDEFDNSDYSVAGDITDHRDGTVTVKMGKLTELESALALLLGGAE